MMYCIWTLQSHHSLPITLRTSLTTHHSPLHTRRSSFTSANDRIPPSNPAQCTLSLFFDKVWTSKIYQDIHIVLYNLHSSSPSILVPLIFNNYRQYLFTTMTKLQCKTIMTSQQVKTFLAGRHYRLVELQQQMTREPNSAYMYCKLIYFICA